MIVDVHSHVWNKVLFGTDYPIANVQTSLAGLRGLNDLVEGTSLPRLAVAEIEAMIHRDSLALLGFAGGCRSKSLTRSLKSLDYEAPRTLGIICQLDEILSFDVCRWPELPSGGSWRAGDCDSDRFHGPLLFQRDA